MNRPGSLCFSAASIVAAHALKDASLISAVPKCLSLASMVPIVDVIRLTNLYVCFSALPFFKPSMIDSSGASFMMPAMLRGPFKYFAWSVTAPKSRGRPARIG